MPDRTQMPPLRPLEDLRSPKPECATLSNGIKLYCLDAGHLAIARLDVVFGGGRWTEHRPLTARGVAGLLMEGTCRHSGSALAEKTDFFGATMGANFYMDALEVSLFSLSRHFDELLPLMADVLTCPSFPAEELRTFIEQSKTSLLVDLEQAEVAAYRTFTEKIFGSRHPYGYNSTPEGYTTLTRADLQRYVAEHFCAANGFAILSGRLTEPLIRQVHHALEQLPPQGRARTPKQIPTPPPHGGTIHVELPHATQTAIYVGRRLWPRNHPDFPALFVLMQILGGYFGSRLIRRIREKLGYTYSIYADLEMMRHDGYCYITTEVAPERVRDTLREIFVALHNLTRHPPEEEEILMVRSYLLGNMLAAIDGPFNQADYTRTYLLDGAPPDMLERIVHTLYHIDADALQRMARKWLDPATMTIVTAGPGKSTPLPEI